MSWYEVETGWMHEGDTHAKDGGVKVAAVMTLEMRVSSVITGGNETQAKRLGVPR